jgi:hypothetical protein
MRGPSLTLVPPAPASAPTPAPTPAIGPAPDAWLEAWRGAIALGWDSLGELGALADPRRFRDRWLADLRQLTVDTLRSPAFLALVKFNLTLLARRTAPPAPR